MDEEMATNTEYILRLVLEMIDKCETLAELKASIEKILEESR